MERSSGTVIFRKNGKEKFLLLHYGKGHWDFPKGHIEEGEAELDAAIREAEEETGISDLKILDGFREKITYFFMAGKNLVHKEVVFFAAETKTKSIKISHEHTGFEWLDFDSALKKLSFKNSRDVLKKANEFLK